MEKENNGIKYILYARKSSDREDRQVQSIPDQVRLMKELARDNGFFIKKILRESKSAKEPGIRPIFQGMMNEIEKGDADGILCWQLNRLSRNPKDSGDLQWMLQSQVIKEIRTYDKVFLPEDNALIFGIESGVGNQFIIDLRKNALRGMNSRVLKGWYPGLARQGYLNSKDNEDKGIIIKDPERFDLIKKAWGLMLTGSHKPPGILKILNEDYGYLTRKTKRKGGKPLSMSEIYRIFKDIFYCGLFEFQGKIYQGKHEAMISMEEYERVQELISGKKKSRKQTHEFAFTGIISCGHCGCMVTAEEKEKFIKYDQVYKTYTYYRCTRRKKGVDCKQPSITLPNLEKQISRELKKITIPENFKTWTLKTIRQINEKEITDRRSIYDMLDKKYKSLQKQLDNLTDMRLKDLVDDNEFRHKKQKLQNEISKIRSKQNHSQDRGQHWAETMERAFNFAAHAKEVFDTTDDLQVKREILSTLGQGFTLKNRQLKIKMSEWLEPISNLSENDRKEIARLEPIVFGEPKNKNTSFKKEMSLWGA